ncbi:MAG TPA: sugar phosphate isomerase/epimerase family protein [Candidatus Acidoferrales bacterium]|nr:sugar phosphate isomerase/epimerase family protein [Candidatus Acidoferrales bacterium]
MQRVLSTYRYVRHALEPSVLAQIAQAGIPAIEIFCAAGHFSYASQQAVRDVAVALEENHLSLYSLHSPPERDAAFGRSGVPNSISEPERVRRIEAVDEVKRALEVAERIPFKYLVQHMGQSRDAADARHYDAAFNSLEHLAIFAKHRGVTIALENTPDELGAPESLLQFLKETHLNDLKLCLDVGHAHIETKIETAFEVMRDRIVTTHIHDNHGEKDEHLVPYGGSIDWEALLGMISGAPHELPIVMELKEATNGEPTLDQAREAFDKIENNLANKSTRAKKS